MPHLSLVYPYPAQGYPDRLLEDDDVADVAIRGCRSVAELYGEALRGLQLPNRLGELRIFTRHRADSDGVTGLVHVDPVHEGFELAHLLVPTDFVRRTPVVRAEMLLQAVHGIVRRLALARGWDPDRLDSCRRHVVDAGYEYRWASSPTSSPDRRLQARAHFRMLPDGYGRAWLELSRREDDAVVAMSDEALAFCTKEGFRRAAKSLRWRGSNAVSMVPYDFGGAFRGGVVALRLGGDRWHSRVEDFGSVREVPAGDPDLPRLAVSVEGTGWTAPEQPPTMYFVGGGPIQSRRIEKFHDLLREQMRRFTGEAGQTWWQGAGLRGLEATVSYGDAGPRVRGRRLGQRLFVYLDRPESSLVGDLGALARQDVEEVVALVRRKTGLGPHPGFPDT